MHQIDRDAARLEQPGECRDALDPPRQRLIDQGPRAICHGDAIHGVRVEWRGELPIDLEQRREDFADRLAEPFGRILHARVHEWVATRPGYGAPQAPMVETADQQPREPTTGEEEQQEHRRHVTGPVYASGCEQQPAISRDSLSDASTDQHLRDSIQNDHELYWQQT